jgi:hypothetical protein
MAAERVKGGELVDVQIFPDEAKAVRAACTYEWHAAVIPHGRGEWALVRVRDAFRDDRRVIDGMRGVPYSRWGSAYERLLAKYPPTARFTSRGVVAEPREPREPLGQRGAKGAKGAEGAEGAGPRRASVASSKRLTVARGVLFWRVYYGAPELSARLLLAEHMAKRDLWALESTRAVLAVGPYAAHVRKMTLGLAAKYAAFLRDEGRAFEAGRIEAAFPQKKLPVYLLPPDSHLDGALYPLHSTRDEAPTAADLDDNRRVIAVKHIPRDAELLGLLAHEIAHALFPPVWQRENHPPAFADANQELRALAGLRPSSQKTRP